MSADSSLTRLLFGSWAAIKEFFCSRSGFKFQAKFPVAAGVRVYPLLDHTRAAHKIVSYAPRVDGTASLAHGACPVGTTGRLAAKDGL